MLAWPLASGGRIGFSNDPRYNKTRRFDPFLFPVETEAQAENICAIAEELDAHRKSRLQVHPQLTLIILYNVLEKLRAGTPLTDAEKDIHEAGQVSILRELHDRLDRAVAEAYGWAADLSAPEIVARVVALNVERRAEEQAGLVRWLRPEFQAPEETRRAAVQAVLDMEPELAASAMVWPRRETEQ